MLPEQRKWLTLGQSIFLNKDSLCLVRYADLDNNLLDEAANAEKAGLVQVKRVQHSSYDFNTLNELAQFKY